MHLDQEPPRLGKYFQFSLRSMVIFGFLVAISGLAANYISGMVYESSWRQHLESSYRMTQNSLNDYSAKASYSKRIDDWYASVVVQNLTSRDSVELVMRRAEKIGVDEYKDDLPRLFGAQQPSDAVLAYRVTEENAAGSSMYAFLIRNDAILTSAVKKPADAHWVEKGANLETYSFLYEPQNRSIATVAACMLGTACLLMLSYFGIAFVCWAFARMTFKPKNPLMLETPSARGGIGSAVAKPS